MLGLRELGLSRQWKFVFSGYSKQVQKQPGTVFVDLGNILELGVIDHHFKDSEYGSCTSALVSNSHLVLNHMLGPINETYYRGIKIQRKELTFTYGTHKNPDWDSMAAFFFCDYLVQHGELPPDNIAKALCEATDTIAQGKARIEDEVLRPFLIYLMMMNNNTPWKDCLLRGKALLEYIIARAGDGISKESFLGRFKPPREFSKEARELQGDFSQFQKDIEKAENFKIFVPTMQEIAVETWALAFSRPPSCRLHKYWVREKTNTGILLVPFANSDGAIQRVIISVNPLDEYILPCLGYELEKEETKKRAKLGKARSGKPRFEKEYCDNEDPWYDGRGHDYTIVDSPNAGTVLEYSEIKEIVKKLYQKPSRYFTKTGRLDVFISYRRKGGSDIAWAFEDLQYHTRQEYGNILGEADALYTRLKEDPWLIQRNNFENGHVKKAFYNRILKASPP